MSMNIPKQDAFFYKGSWSTEVDDKLLSTIIRLQERDPWSGDVIPSWEILATPGICWDLNQKTILANVVWNKIFQQNPFASAYYHRDEP
ncbi:hypothetical protein AAHA92_33024 [Salvia divinorum]|uniref:Uncharacterized protein n=1 Tax=Salvia divinorum TaxID=28513 RepID=A0ABD1FMM7_SALDI